jgi:2-dehydropantoate 2-reductase
LHDRYRSLRNTVAALCSLDEALHTSWKPIAQVQLAMRRKLVVNAVINPLTALMGCRNGDIFTTNAARRIMRRVCDEASKVYEAQFRAETEAWLSSQGTDGHAHMSVGHVPRELTRSFLEEECERVAKLTKGNISSMLSDVRRGKETEIEYINGHLLNLGTTYSIQMPATAMLLNLVKMRSAIPLDQML